MAQPVVVISALLLAAAFAWAGLAKLVRLGDWRSALDGYGLPPALAPPLAIGVPLIELAAAVLLVWGPAKAGGALSVAMLAGFSLAIMRGRALQGEKLPCGCFGRATERDWRLMLLRNSALFVPAALVLLFSDGSSIVDNASRVSPGDLLPALLVIAAIALVGWLATEVGSIREKERGS